MKKIGLIAAAAALIATTSLIAPTAYAGPGLNSKFSNGPGPGPGPGLGPKPGPKPGLSSHGYGHGHYGHGGGYWGAGLAVVGAGLSLAATEDCYTVRRKVLIPGVGIVVRRALVCG